MNRRTVIQMASLPAIRLGVESYREGKVKAFDPQTQQVLDAAPARTAYSD